MAVPMMAWGQSSSEALAPDNTAITLPTVANNPHNGDRDAARKEPESCHIRQVTSLPGSHEFASDFIETIATDPAARHSDTIWGLTADLSSKVPFPDRALYISKSTNGGETWTEVAQLRSRYFDAGIAEGLRNGLSVAPGGREFVVTTQLGAFQVLLHAAVKAIAGPTVPHQRPKISIPKKEGDPIRANVVAITADGRHMIVGYGYFDLDPQMFRYRKDRGGSWIEDGRLPALPTDMDILSIQFDNPRNVHPASLYVGTGDQAYRLDLRTMKWRLIDGVGPDSAIHGMTTVGGLHLAACWGVYNPAGDGAVKRITNARFLLHRATDEVGPNLRAYSIEVDPSRPNREIVTSITGVYISSDSGDNWRRLNDLPEGEFRTAHFNSDGAVIISGMPGTFLANPFASACSPHLKRRDK